MPYTAEYSNPGPTRAEIDQLPGPVLLEFGVDWCPYCQGLAPDVKELLTQYPDVRHVKVEDGKGRPLGRSFGVKLWPNFVFLRDGQLRKQAARPDRSEVEDGLQRIAGQPA